ncbi:MAG: TIGR04283 family arsenosugar biosynthesis glycosyltransferase [Gammaproteobacteria bacterium]
MQKKSSLNHYISFIIPVLNEEKTIVSFLKGMQYYRQNGHEIILVDGGSDDNTVTLAQHYVDQSLVSKPGRAYQMNLGAKRAKNTVFVFLHSDTKLPEAADISILKSLSSQNNWGRFNVNLRDQNFIFRIIETMMNLRSKYTLIATGDQGIFITKEAFFSVNGFPEIPLMEDIAISKKLRQRYSCACLSDKVSTSSRRWQEHGIIKTILLMWMLRFLYFIGISPNKLVELYYGKK